MEELEIVNRIWNRNEDALQLLAQQYSLFCRKIAFNFLSDEADVEEILNDVWLGVWNSIPPNRLDNLSSYLAKISLMEMYAFFIDKPTSSYKTH